MTDLLERLADTNPVHTIDLAPSVDDVWRKLDDGSDVPQRRRRQRLSPNRRHATRWATFGVAAVAAAVSLLIVGTTGGAPTSAFAGWSADPTTPTSGQVQAALSSCDENTAPTLADTRGPFSLLLFAQNGSSAAPVICISGPALTGRPTALPSFTQSGGQSLAPGSISLATSGAILVVDPTDGATYRLIDGQVAAGVTAVTLLLDDGSQVQATTQNGWFAAWWPGTQGVQTSDITTPSGTTTQALAVPALVPGSAGATSPAGATPRSTRNTD